MPPIPWRRNVWVLTFTGFVTFVGIGFMYPLIPLYLQEIGINDAQDVRLWAGAIGTGQGISFALSAPLWGILADRVGRKPMVVRAMVVSGFGVASVSLMRDPWLILLVVTLRASASAPGTTANALLSATVPSGQLTRAISSMQAAQVVGMSGGPMLGGLLVGLVGMRTTFLIGGAISVLAGILVLLFVVERFERLERTVARPSVFQNAAAALRGPLMVLVALQGLLWMVGNGTIPIMTLHVQELGGTESAALTTGIIQGLFSAAAVVGIVATSWLIDRFGFRAVLLWASVGFGTLFIPQGLATNVVMLGAARMAQGVFFGLIGPAVQSLVGLAAPSDRRATAYGTLATFSGGGGALGPMSLGAVAAVVSLPASFFVAGLLVVPVVVMVLTKLDISKILRAAESAEATGNRA
ncbi:MAG: MFS transporter [Chloroflexota bacterium]|nr:MFS transporter [Chloroflexota bacterium]MDP6757396.1 MFS transporter [Chloroflexota bacterium]